MARKLLYLVGLVLVFVGCLQNESVDSSMTSTSTLTASSSTVYVTTSSTGTSTSTTLQQQDKFMAEVGCIPVGFIYSGNELVIQANSSVVPQVRTKSRYTYKLSGVDMDYLLDGVLINRRNLFVYYSKKCCDEGDYNSYHYFILAVDDPGAKTKYIPSVPNLFFNYADLGNHKNYNFKQSGASGDIEGVVRTWDECGREFILSIGSEGRRKGEFYSEKMIDELGK